MELHRIPGSPNEEVAFVGETVFAVVQRLQDSTPGMLAVVGVRGGVAVGTARNVSTLLTFVWGCFLREEQSHQGA